MLKLLIGLVGLIEALYPDRFISILTDLSYDYEGEPPIAKPWVVTAARIEGIVLLGVAIRAAIKADWAGKADATGTDDADPASEPSGTVDRI
jgi:hypothetical protein